VPDYRSGLPRVVVIGPVGRDLLLRIGGLPEGGGSAPVEQRTEVLGGKGANQAVACRQLGVSAALVGVVGDDESGSSVIAQAETDGIDVIGVLRRSNAATALMIDILEPGGTHRLLEHFDPATDLTETDVRAHAHAIREADAVLVPLKQSEEAILAALELAPTSALVVADGAPATERVREAVLRRADVLRADAGEARDYLGDSTDLSTLIGAARCLLTDGPHMIAFGIEGGDAAVWTNGELTLPHASPAVDPTGAGDSFVAALTVGLLSGAGEETALRWASLAAGDTATRPGARPDLHVERLRNGAG